MKLKDLLEEVDDSFKDIEISGICHETAEVKKGSLFFCLVGNRFDGHDFAAEACCKGAAAVVCEHAVSADCPRIVVKCVRKAFSKASAAFFGYPANGMRMFGITGTNGKTTTSYILAEILKEAGEEVGLIGTNCIRYCGMTLDASLTTPDPTELNSVLRRMRDSGVTSVVMEVSAHALALDKTEGIVFEAVGFTNLSQDHLDYFGDMKKYGEAKSKLFCSGLARCAAINVDDEFGRKLMKRIKIPALSYGRNNPSDVFGINLVMSAEGLRYVINIEDDLGEVKFALPGRFNMYNTLCAATMAHMAGVSTKDILQGIRSLRRVDGRYNVINASGFNVIIDFAHTDDGLMNIITSVREFAPKRIITVFGCGGNRDKTKRAAMGNVAARLSDITVMTSDNPRDEEPEEIISDAMKGVPSDKADTVYVKPDRREAIKFALSEAEKDDIVLVAGKGAERYQEIKGVKYEYNDEEYIMGLLQNGSVND